MEPLMLEIRTQGLHQYHRLDKAQTRVGRALDNDVILSDPTVAPHHVIIHCNDDGKIDLENLSPINPVKISKPDQSPLDFKLGRISARVLPSDHTVEETRSIAGHGHNFHLFEHTLWAILLPLLCLIIGGLQYYFNTHSILKWDALFGHILRGPALNLTAYIVGLAIIERLLVNRWEIKLVTICVSLVYLLFFLVNLMVDQLMYYFSSQWPSTLFGIGWLLFFIPAAMSYYLIKVSHFKPGRSILLAIFISSPFAFPALVKNPIVKNLTGDFSAAANYHKHLSVFNWHLSDTVSVSEFIEQAENLEPGEIVD